MADLERTVLYDLHVALGARMVPFAGYEMPVQYPMGVMKEHLHTRAEAGLFDVGHMGQVILRAKSGKVEDAALALERLVPVDVLGLGLNKQRYAMFTNDAGGILDDLMVANRGDHLFLVVNAACKAEDVAHLKAHLSGDCEVTEITDRGLLALQGPTAEAALAALVPGAAAMKFMEVGIFGWQGAELWISATPARTDTKFRCRATRPGRWPRRCWRSRAWRPSGWVRATACGWKPACAFTGMTSTPAPRRSKAT